MFYLSEMFFFCPEMMGDRKIKEMSLEQGLQIFVSCGSQTSEVYYPPLAYENNNQFLIFQFQLISLLKMVYYH